MRGWPSSRKLLAVALAATILLVAWIVRFETGFITETDIPELFATAPRSAGSVVSGDLSPCVSR